MRLLQRLAAGMCERRAADLRSSRTMLGHAARERVWVKLPPSVQGLFTRAAKLTEELDDLEAQIERAGYSFSAYELRKRVRNQAPVPFKDAANRERESHKIIDKRIEKVQRVKERALRDLLGMSEKDGKVYLDKLEKELAGDC